MWGKASARAASAQSSRRLMHRLEALETGGRLDIFPEPVRRRPKRGIFFVLGLMGGVLGGAVWLVALEAVTPAQIVSAGERGVAAVAEAVAAWTAEATASQPETPPQAVAHTEQPDTFDVFMDRG